ncbi:hypothetical protein FY557_17410 [Chryseobacterium sp. SN22]|uniref:hypothetical protein n=1 Tax=Chryseobacterium sp. SN22 TaxID=2606431 RepID=UPI0011EC1F7A|nr:hypothetical protein [Chryseobacterium sp. SN22]KAA0126428.1 hypothetical protein FY557_17410 [Chryseobacterium sp. SN22]
MEDKPKVIVIGHPGVDISLELMMLEQKVHLVTPEKFEIKPNPPLPPLDLAKLIRPIYDAERYTPGKHRAGNNSKRPKKRKKKR